MKITNIGSEDAYRDNTIRDSNSFLLVYDTCNQSSLKKIPVLFPKIHEARVAIEGGSLNSTSIAPPLPSVVVVGTKSNRIDERKVTTKKGRMVAKGLDCEFCEVTAKGSVTKVFLNVIQHYNLPSPSKSSEEGKQD